MNKKKKVILIVIGALSLLTLTVILINFLSGKQYRRRLPQLPDLSSVAVSLRNQISSAAKKAYFCPTPANLGKMGMIYHSSAYYDKAISCYKLALQRQPANWIWSYYLGLVNIELGNSQEACKNFKYVTTKEPDNKLSVYYTGLSYQGMGNQDSAVASYIRLLNASDKISYKDTIRENYFPVETHARFNLARVYLGKNMLDDAEIALKEIITAYNDFGPAYRLLGNLYQRKGDSELAHNYIERANDLATEVIPPIDTLADKITLLSRSELYLLKQIDLAVRSVNYDWATVLCLHALKYLPDDKFVISKTLKNHLQMGYIRQAFSLIKKHMKYFAEDYDELIEIASLLFDNGFHENALEYFNLAKKLRPDNFNLTVWLHKRGFINEAYNLLNEQLNVKPDDIYILSAAVVIYFDAGIQDTAEQYFLKLKKLAPEHTNVLKFSGMFAEKNNNQNEAIAFYEKVIKHDQKDAYIIQKLENYYVSNKKWDKLLELYSIALKGDPNQPYLLFRIGSLFLECPDPKYRNLNKTIEYTERAFININSSFEIRLQAAKNLAEAFNKKGNMEKSDKYLNIIKEMINKVSTSSTLI